MLSIVCPVSLCKVLYCCKLIRYCSFVFIVIYALYVPGMLELMKACAETFQKLEFFLEGLFISLKISL